MRTVPKLRSRAIAVFDTAQLAGVVLGGWFGGVMAQQGHWRYAFFALGIVGILFAVPYFLFLKGTSEEAAVETKKIWRRIGDCHSDQDPQLSVFVPRVSSVHLCVVVAVHLVAQFSLREVFAQSARRLGLRPLSTCRQLLWWDCSPGASGPIGCTTEPKRRVPGWSDQECCWQRPASI